MAKRTSRKELSEQDIETLVAAFKAAASEAVEKFRSKLIAKLASKANGKRKAIPKRGKSS